MTYDMNCKSIVFDNCSPIQGLIRVMRCQLVACLNCHSFYPSNVLKETKGKFAFAGDEDRAVHAGFVESQ